MQSRSKLVMRHINQVACPHTHTGRRSNISQHANAEVQVGIPLQLMHLHRELQPHAAQEREARSCTSKERCKACDCRGSLYVILTRLGRHLACQSLDIQRCRQTTDSHLASLLSFSLSLSLSLALALALTLSNATCSEMAGRREIQR